MRRFVKTVRYHASTNFYQILGVNESSSFREIRNNYIQKIKAAHPDVEDGCHNQFIAIQKAFETLSNPKKRVMYDNSIGIYERAWQIESDETNSEFENQKI